MKARVQAAVASHLSRVIAVLADRARETLPRDVRVEVGDEGLTLVGRRLRARRLSDARLRNIGR